MQRIKLHFVFVGGELYVLARDSLRHQDECEYNVKNTGPLCIRNWIVSWHHHRVPGRQFNVLFWRLALE